MIERKFLFLSHSLFFFLFFIFFIFFPTHQSFSSTQRIDQPTGQPTSIEDFSCGRYRIGGQLETDPTGKDFLLLYPDSDREFAVPLLGMTAKESLLHQKLIGFFEVDFPLSSKRQRQGHFYFKKFLKTAALEEIYQTASLKIAHSCFLADKIEN